MLPGIRSEIVLFSLIGYIRAANGEHFRSQVRNWFVLFNSLYKNNKHEHEHVGLSDQKLCLKKKNNKHEHFGLSVVPF
jgi:hypothetical protein